MNFLQYCNIKSRGAEDLFYKAQGEAWRAMAALLHNPQNAYTACFETSTFLVGKGNADTMQLTIRNVNESDADPLRILGARNRYAVEPRFEERCSATS